MRNRVRKMISVLLIAVFLISAVPYAVMALGMISNIQVTADGIWT